MLTPRERVLRALDHEEPDRVPLMIGGGGATTLLGQAQDRLKEALGNGGETRVIFNPIQVSAREMGDTARLKRELGRRISFCGGIDTQHVMPRGTAGDVRAEVRRRLRGLAPGGYLLAAVHCIQPDVPPEDVLCATRRSPRARVRSHSDGAGGTA